MKRKQEFTYNEHDRSQVVEILRARKKRRRKKIRRKLLIVFVFILIVSYFFMDISRVQQIDVIGNARLQEEEIKDRLEVKENHSIQILVSPNAIKENVKELPGIKDVNVSRNFLGNITITIEETALLGYAILGEDTYVIDEKGNVFINNSSHARTEIQRCPQIFNMGVELLETFAKEYSKIPSQVLNQTSEIIYEPQNADETRCRFNMNDGKVLFLRIEDMASQLAGDRYARVINDAPNSKYYDFVGDKNVYNWE